MANTNDLRRDIRRWSSRVRDRAVRDIERDLDKRVPIGPPRSGGGVKLNTSRKTRPLNNGDVVGVSIEYTAPQGEWTDAGTRPHQIRGNPLLVFFWPKVGRTVAFPKVNHPGNPPQNWWSDVVNAANWRSALSSAARSTSL